jgi:hypothetical protein
MKHLTATLATAALLAVGAPVLTAPGALASGGDDDGSTHGTHGSDDPSTHDAGDDHGGTRTGSSSDDDGLMRGGTCSNGATWKIKAKPDDGRIEVEAEIDTNRVGQSWTWVLRHNGSVSARGTSRTTTPSGSFDVERRTVDAAGADTFRFRATHDGAVCVATLTR